MPDALQLLPIVALVVAVGLGALAQGATGIGFALLAAPACALVLDPDQVVGTVARVGLLVDLSLVVQGRASVDRRIVWNYLWPAMVAVPFAVLAAATVPDGLLVVGVAVLTLVGAATLLGARVLPPQEVVAGGRTPQLVAGFAAGFMGVTTGMSGPPLAVESARRHASPAQTRATLAVLFVAVDVAAIVANPVGPPLATTAILVLAAGCGLLAARRVAGRLDGPHLQRALGLLVVAGALALLVRQLT